MTQENFLPISREEAIVHANDHQMRIVGQTFMRGVESGSIVTHWHGLEDKEIILHIENEQGTTFYRKEYDD